MVYRFLLRPPLFLLPAERAHDLALLGAKILGQSHSLAALVHRFAKSADLPVSLMGLNFPNPVGLAAGMDKNGVAPLAWWAFGFGFAELGTVTPLAQEGNDKPRMFRYRKEGVLVNRMGFNNGGAAALAERLRRQAERGLRPAFPIGISVGKNKNTSAEQAADDFTKAAAMVAPQADFLTVNVSSPNTDGLRALQNAEDLRRIIRGVRGVAGGKPVLVKIAPELAGYTLEAVLDTALAEGAAGIIATNTLSTKDKPNRELGGESGTTLREISLRKVEEVRKLIGTTPVLIGCGGIDDAASAQAMLDAGANLVQLYTALVYQGPFLPAAITRGLRHG